MPNGDTNPQEGGAGWSQVSLADVCTILSGGTPSKAEPGYWSGDIPWVSGKDLKVPRLRDAIDHVSSEAVGSGTRMAPAGAVFLLVRGMGLAKDLPVALALRPMAFNQDIKALVPKDRRLGPFVRAAIYHGRDRLRSRIVPSAHGTMTLNLDDVEQFQIAMPDNVEEAVAIGAALELVSERQELAGAEASALESLKRVAMRALFTRGLRGDTQKETDIGLVPQSWDVVEFSTVREWLQYGTSTRCSHDPSEFPVLRIPNIRPGRVNAQDLKFGTLPAEEAARYRLEDGDLLFIRTNGVIERLGACAVYDGEPDHALFASYLIRARLKRNRIDPYFAAHFYGSELGTSIVAGRATPAADGKFNLNTGTIDTLPIPLPPTIDEQREIGAILDAIDRKLDLHRRKRAVLDDLFRALLHKMMTREIRVADLDLSALTAKPAAEAA
jgi:type I restriction enzyme, S subunit